MMRSTTCRLVSYAARGGRYSTRRRVPTALIAHYRRADIVRALGTSDPAEARRRHTLMWQALTDAFDASARVVSEAAAASRPTSVRANLIIAALARGYGATRTLLV